MISAYPSGFKINTVFIIFPSQSLLKFAIVVLWPVIFITCLVAYCLSPEHQEPGNLPDLFSAVLS